MKYDANDIKHKKEMTRIWKKVFKGIFWRHTTFCQNIYDVQSNEANDPTSN